MPVQSEAQRRYLNVHFGHDWVRKHHFDQKGKLPAHVPKRKRGRKRSRDQMVRGFMKKGRRG